MTIDFDYSVRVKNGAGWRAFDRARLMISVGQPYHEGKKLKAAVDWINRNPEIRHVHISVNDLLQRHNHIAAGLLESQASAVALAEGTLWIERNADILASIKAETTLTRWNDWLSRPEFAQSVSALAAYADTDILFEDALNTDAHALAERKIRRGEIVAHLDRLVSHSRDYIDEELAVFALHSRELPAAEVYPGSNLASAHYLIGKDLPEAIRPLAGRHFTRIDFAHINAVPSPQPRHVSRLDLK
jgi:tRNA-dependent cyclodipeptide synthase